MRINRQQYENVMADARAALAQPEEVTKAGVVSLVAVGLIALESFNDGEKLQLLERAANMADRVVCDCPEHMLN